MGKSDVICLHFLETTYRGLLSHESTARFYFADFVNPSLCTFPSLIWFLFFIFEREILWHTTLIYQASRRELTRLDNQNKARITEANNVIVESTEKSFNQKSVYICPQTTFVTDVRHIITLSSFWHQLYKSLYNYIRYYAKSFKLFFHKKVAFPSKGKQRCYSLMSKSVLRLISSYLGVCYVALKSCFSNFHWAVK